MLEYCFWYHPVLSGSV
jgi:hypothetical protein